jgi:histidinol-phosphate aminotransferase
VTHDGLAIVPGALRLHYNENTAGASPAVLAAIGTLSRAAIGEYPEVDRITERVARWLGVGAGQALVTNGLDEGIQIVAQSGAWHGGNPPSSPAAHVRSEIVIVEPAFEVYEFVARAAGAIAVHLPPEPGFRFPLDRLLRAITAETRVIYLTDPNNPTGLGIPAGAVERILTAAPEALVLVDEAYADFSGRTYIGPLLRDYPNLVVGRTFAKAHGLAALRIGALVAHPDTIRALRFMQLPFSVNVAAMIALEAALEDPAYLAWYVAESAASRALIYDFCRRHGVEYWPSDANFVLIRVGADAAALTDALRARGILVRDKSSSPGCAGCIRLTAGVAADTRTALSAMEEILATRAR